MHYCHVRHNCQYFYQEVMQTHTHKNKKQKQKPDLRVRKSEEFDDCLYNLPEFWPSTVLLLALSCVNMSKDNFFKTELGGPANSWGLSAKGEHFHLEFSLLLLRKNPNLKLPFFPTELVFKTNLLMFSPKT